LGDEHAHPKIFAVVGSEASQKIEFRFQFVVAALRGYFK